MAALDRTKEKIAYHKFWQGVWVVTDISLIGWLVSVRDALLPTVLALAGVFALTVGVFLLHRHIERLIDQTGTL
jgi:hypothetical protein